jgi:hypothetical protein
MVKGLLDRWHRMTQAKILREKGVPDLPRSCIQGMALKPRLHPDGADLLPKMLLGIADDLLGHGVRQRIVRFIMDGDTRHGDAPLSSWQVAAVLCVSPFNVSPLHGRHTIMLAYDFL